MHRRPLRGRVFDPKHIHCAFFSDPLCKERHRVSTRCPLAEPPTIDYNTFIEKTLPSDVRYSKLFPNEVRRWTQCRDHASEWYLLGEYKEWATDMAEYERDLVRRDFYRELLEGITLDYNDVHEETRSAFCGAGELEVWEYENLDQNGDTKGIEAWTEHRWDDQMKFKEVWNKYWHLAPSGYVPQNKHWYWELKGVECPFLCWNPKCAGLRRQREQQVGAAAVLKSSSSSGSIASDIQELSDMEDGDLELYHDPPS